ncbi:DoxX family protein [Rhizobium sp. SL86]|uniref:DoxX family protein n=1 Tax=Rhizobium sp. SL86 TaxID=2995148 RepID=UPI002276536D|nr:DoxX family protein [Rhizobium sp. SL86]MCY1664130.1 DoxX family protein [Rhizobium sp. SL86]
MTTTDSGRLPSALDIFATNWFGYLARTVLTFMFWGSGLSKLLDFPGGVAEMAHFGLEPAVAFNIAVIITQLGGSALIILNRHAWLGAGALAVFTLLTIPIAHNFWALEEPMRTFEFHVAGEHLSIVGALMLVAWKCR